MNCEEPLARTLAALDRLVPGRLERDAPLGARTTYRVGGPARGLLRVASGADLDLVHEALQAAEGPVPLLCLGQGSNLLVADAGFPGLVLFFDPGAATLTMPTPEGLEPGCSVLVRADAGYPLPILARRAAASGLGSVAWAVGIPGSVGGAVRMNAGGHGADTASCLVAAWVADLARGTLERWDPGRLGHGYRSSRLGPEHAVVAAELQAQVEDLETAKARIAEIVRWRRANQPGGANAGSVFANPPGDAAGRLVEEAGLKGWRQGSAAVSAKHANFVQADPGGRAEDVRRVIDHVQATVARRLGVELRLELRLVGFSDQPLPVVEAVGSA
ncbi:UDP-N-acetylmuramate dehydrogenase [Aciditerrimonas ferrireducens]|uniref:UDP-N-acetylenolpyruvoylglucosamine reductase n=1 Tax=Aciditerrimonas ferrireducens TaxID=667306 RepID=A0ABV6C2L9_9ACTN